MAVMCDVKGVADSDPQLEQVNILHIAWQLCHRWCVSVCEWVIEGLIVKDFVLFYFTGQCK